MATLFSLSNLLVLPFWALMILLPHWRWTHRLVNSPLIVLPPVALYALVVLPRLPEVLAAVASPALVDIAALLGTPAGALAAWTHFLAFDLFVGRWIYLDGQARRLSAWLMAPVLLLTLLLGPLGLALYLAVRAGSMLGSSDARPPDPRSSRPTLTAQEDDMDMVSQAPAQWPTRLPWLDPRPALARALALNRPLAILGLAMLGLFGAALVGLGVDGRVVTGAPAWLKPAKFAISLAIYSFTFLWLLSFVRGRPRLVGLASWATVLMFAVEIIVIVVQAARGTTSHFNVATPLDAALWTVMGISIMVVWLMNALAAVLLLVARLPDRAFAWSLRLALLLSLVGMAVALPMTSPTAAQQAAWAAGAPVTTAGAHSIGVPDGGPGLPIVGWSTIGGDLRPAHFIGLHAMQVMPFLGWLIARRARRLGPGHRLALVWLTGLTYLGLILLLAWQALRGQPLVAPDALTLTVLAGLAGAAILGAGAVVMHARWRAAGGAHLLAPAQPA